MSFQPGPNEPMGYGGQRNRGWSPGRFSPAILAVAVVVIVILVGAAVISRRNGSPSATPTASPVGQPITAPSSSAASSASAAPSTAQSAAASSSARASTSAAAASAKPKVYLVANTDGDGVYLRKTPSMNDRLTAYVDGTELVAIGPDVTAEGELWHNVRAPDGQTGYVPAKYTVDAPE